jgi:4-amino-4-deoxy-L-arabinose transferase-like glycosyltransferase
MVSNLFYCPKALNGFKGDSFGGDAKKRLFLFSSSLFFGPLHHGVFLPILAVIGRIKNILLRKEEWLTTGTFITLLLIVSFSGFKLPHYLNIVFPTTAILTGSIYYKQKK